MLATLSTLGVAKSEDHGLVPHRWVGMMALWGEKEPNATCGLWSAWRDCPLNYNLTELNSSSLQLHRSDAKSAVLKAQAQQACSSSIVVSQDTGGYCYRLDESVEVPARQWCAQPGSGRPSCFVDLADCTAAHDDSDPRDVCRGNLTDTAYSIPDGHMFPDEGALDILTTQIFSKAGACSTPACSIADFGAGVGQYGRALKARMPDLKYIGYDAGGNVEEFTDGFVTFADLTVRQDLPKVDWVWTSEVGEHIPHELEKEFIGNIHATNCKGIVLSWAKLGQNGRLHVNTHSSEYLDALFVQLGYRINEEIGQMLRTRGHWSYHVYEREETPPGC